MPIPLHRIEEPVKMKVTRGDGFLEGFLAQQRAKAADTLIPELLRSGRILDIGCGSFPFFLVSTNFSEKHGLDRVLGSDVKRCQAQGIRLSSFDMETEQRLPYPDSHFDIVTMLAVFEHIEPVRLVMVLKEVLRVLKPGGQYILTTPAAWTDPLLRLLARLNVVSREEIDEHKDSYSHGKIVKLLKEAGFAEDHIQCGYFLLGMNNLVGARK